MRSYCTWPPRVCPRRPLLLDAYVVKQLSQSWLSGRCKRAVKPGTVDEGTEALPTHDLPQMGRRPERWHCSQQVAAQGWWLSPRDATQLDWLSPSQLRLQIWTDRSFFCMRGLKQLCSIKSRNEWFDVAVAYLVYVQSARQEAGGERCASRQAAASAQCRGEECSHQGSKGGSSQKPSGDRSREAENPRQPRTLRVILL